MSKREDLVPPQIWKSILSLHSSSVSSDNAAGEGKKCHRLSPSYLSCPRLYTWPLATPGQYIRRHQFLHPGRDGWLSNVSGAVQIGCPVIRWRIGPSCGHKCPRITWFCISKSKTQWPMGKKFIFVLQQNKNDHKEKQTNDSSSPTSLQKHHSSTSG